MELVCPKGGAVILNTHAAPRGSTKCDGRSTFPCWYLVYHQRAFLLDNKPMHAGICLVCLWFCRGTQTTAVHLPRIRTWVTLSGCKAWRCNAHQFSSRFRVRECKGLKPGLFYAKVMCFVQICGKGFGERCTQAIWQPDFSCEPSLIRRFFCGTRTVLNSTENLFPQIWTK